jgi:glycosyltransferase involved in cell wall biosynthesis
MNLSQVVVRHLVSATVVMPPLRPVLRTAGRVLRRFGWSPAPRATILPDAAYEQWIRSHDTLDEADRAAIRLHVAGLRRRPLISVVMPAYETPAGQLSQAIASVRAQLYPDWELCIADDASTCAHVGEILSEAAALDPRIRWIRRGVNGHIAAASNTALAMARGEFVALMDHDDILPERALYEVAAELEAHPETDIVYTDEDKIDGAGRRFDPYFKPDWSIDLMLGHNLISHLGVYRRSLLAGIGGFRTGFEGGQDYDLALRAVGATAPGRIRHIPEILYHWRQAASGASFSQAQLDRCVDAARLAVADHLRARGVRGAEVLPAPLVPTWSRVRWPVPDPAPRVSVIVAARGGPEPLRRCLDGLLRRTDYPDLEILVAGNGSGWSAADLGHAQRDGRLRMLPSAGPRNAAALTNEAAGLARGEVLVLLGEDIEVTRPDWLREMVSLAIRPDVGAVGAKLLQGNNRVLHAGLVLRAEAETGGAGIAGRLGQGAERDDPGYYGQYALTRGVSAVTGKCLALRKSVYEAVEGLDAERLPYLFHDIDLCLRIRERQLAVIWSPFAQLRHREPDPTGAGIDTGCAASELDCMRRRWGGRLDADPFYNQVFDRAEHGFRLAPSPGRPKPWRHAAATLGKP